jgi:hypothetical protein
MTITLTKAEAELLLEILDAKVNDQENGVVR